MKSKTFVLSFQSVDGGQIRDLFPSEPLEFRLDGTVLVVMHLPVIIVILEDFVLSVELSTSGLEFLDVLLILKPLDKGVR